MSSSSIQREQLSLLNYFKSLNFTQPLSINLLSTTLDAIKVDLTGEDLKSVLIEKITCESFLLKEVIYTSKFYD